ncbi:glycerol-3-phosphate 1-O-acyltransferase PlsY [Atopobiaceae bacterium 24-176]
MGTSVTLVLLLLMLATYCICGIPFGLLFGSADGVDVRAKGSGNIGTTNVAREVGAKAAALTLLCDIAKGFVCTFFGVQLLAFFCFGGDVATVLPMGAWSWCGACLFLAAVCGHVFSPYLRFKGGKGIAVGFGAALGISWPIALGLLVVWALCTVPSRVVSLGSVAAAVALPFLAFFIYQPSSWAFELPFVLVAVVVVWAHRQNIAKMRAGDESTFSMKSGDSPDEAVSAEEAARADVSEAGRAHEPSAFDRARRSALAETAAVDSAERSQSVAEVQEEAQEAAEKDASEVPPMGEGLFFGDEDVVTEHIKDEAKRGE